MTATATEAPRDEGRAADEPAANRPPKSIGRRVVDVLGSMKLAVVLLAILAALTWLGTLAQIEDGLWYVQKEFFESWGLIAELRLSWWGNPLFVGEDGEPWPLRIPMPGAYPVMALLFVNLIVGGLLRMKWQRRNAGVLILHLGMALLLLAGFVKLEYSNSGRVALYETPDQPGRVPGRSYEATTYTSFHDNELALLKDNGDTIEERVVPESELGAAVDGTVTLRADDLPFTVQVYGYMENCIARQKGPMVPARTPVIDTGDGGPKLFLDPKPRASERGANIAGCYVTVRTNDNRQLRTVLLCVDSQPRERRAFPFTFEVDGQRYGLDLRRVVYDLPFSMRLNRFVKRDHPGTMTPADFRSFVDVGEDGEHREVQIWMNNPLRKDGYVAYQTSWGPQIGGRPAGGPPWFSVFEVAQNPSDKWPEYACWVIAVGLLIHFGMKLKRFLDSSTRKVLNR